eukprot:scaffold137517_cov48-Attheya_sp.AAC.1
MTRTSDCSDSRLIGLRHFYNNGYLPALGTVAATSSKARNRSGTTLAFSSFFTQQRKKSRKMQQGITIWRGLI